MGTFSFRQQAAYTVLLFSLLLVLVPQAANTSDAGFWLRWATYSFHHGLGNVYQVADNNYNPLYHYILWLYGKMAGSPASIAYNIHWLKAYTLVFDFAGAFWAASLVPERNRRFRLALLLLFNIGYLYNTLVWMQVDAIYTFFAFGAVVLAGRQRPVGSLLLFLLALATKTQAIIFLPPLLLLWVPQWWRRPGQLVRAGGAGAGLAVLVLAPFIWGGQENYLPRIIDINQKSVGLYPTLSSNAYNIWYHLAPLGNPQEVNDLLPFAGLTYRSWGLLLFCTFSAVALLPLLLAAGRGLLARSASPTGRRPDMALVLLSCGLIPLLFTFFNTQMHERYWHAAILFLGAYGFLRRDYLPYVLASVAYFLNMEAVMRHLELYSYGIPPFQARSVLILFGLTIVLVLLKLYRLASWRWLWPTKVAGQVASAS